MFKSTPKILIGLIHNYDKKRYPYIRKNLLSLKKELKKNYKVEYTEVAFQSQIMPLKFTKTILRKINLWVLSRKFAGYRKYTARNILFDLLILMHRFITVYLNKDWEGKRAAIDITVTDKHIRLWNFFFEKKFDYLICFEDDVLFKKNSTLRLASDLKSLAKLSETPVYLNLGGGQPTALLGDRRLLVKQAGGKRFHEKPVTNTAACYLLNHLSVGIFMQTLLQNPILRFFAVDHLLNMLFIMTASNNKFYSYHSIPPIFVHGSIEGKYKSWIEKN